MKILFIQLPRQEPSPEAASANVPLIPGRLVALATSLGLLLRDDCVILDDAVADHGGDAAVAAAAMGTGATLAVFVLFPWNLDRSIWLARKLRSMMPATWFAACGPEAVQGMPVFKAHAFDAIIEGECEFPFIELLRDLERREPKPRYAAAEPADPALLPDPWLEGILPVREDKPVLAELCRDDGHGRADRYSQWPALPARRFPQERIAQLMRLASMRGAFEFRLLDSPLDCSPSQAGFLKGLAAANEGGVPLRAELDLGSITEDTVRLLHDASLSFVDAELLSTNPLSLAAVGRSLDKAGFERGLGLLWSRDISVRPLVLLGLPHDSYETTVDTFDFLGMAGMGQDAQLRPLALAPGSELRRRSQDFGIREFLENPPYWAIETDWLDEDGFLDAVADFEESFDVAWGRPIAPSFAPARGGFVSFIDARDPGAIDAALVAPERLASSVTVMLDADDPERAARLARAARDLRRENPFTLWQIVLHSDNAIPGDRLADRLADAFSSPEHYFELSRLFSLDPQPNFQVRVFFSTCSEALALRALREHARLETVFVLGQAMPSQALVENLPFLAFDRDATPFELMYDAMSAWRDFPDMLVEMPAELSRGPRKPAAQ